MAIASLSRDQLCFAILTESQAISCHYLFSLVVDALKATNSSKWKEAVCNCFGRGVGQHVKQRLEEGQAIRDFYAVSKALRARIRDVAKRMKGKPLDLHGRERLSLKIQGVETARHWLFHGEQYVSPWELRSSLLLLIEVLNSLSHQRGNLPPVVKRLHSLLQYAEELSTSQVKDNMALNLSAVRCAFLHTALHELKQTFTAFFHQREGKLKSEPHGTKSKRQTKRERTQEEFSFLFSEIRKASIELKKKGKWEENGQENATSIMEMCNIVSELRNASAHGSQPTWSEVKSGVSYICHILSAFHLSSEQSTAAQNQLKRLPEDDANHLCLCFLERDNNFETCKEHTKRLLLPKGQHFVGRTQEVLAVLSALQEEACAGTWKPIVLAFGPPGIGKSYLAAEVAHSLSTSFKTQAWISCSTSHHLQEDLHLACKLSSRSKSVTMDSNEADLGCLPPDAKNIASLHLYSLIVFDDVCVSTLRDARNCISSSCSSVIITTKSPTVKLALQKGFPSLFVVELQPFSLAESLQLVEKKVNVSAIDSNKSACMDKVLCGVLGNLPLSVMIYSSLLAVTIRKPERAQFDVFDERLVVENWEVVEEEFGDRLHVRGFSGVVQSAESHLRKFTLASFLLAKIVLARSEHIPWEVLRSNCSNFGHPVLFDIEAKGLGRLIYGLLGVTDWLFSDAGNETLEECRLELEDLGLISWEELTNTVNIHQLTLKISRHVLSANKLFLGDLLDCLYKGRLPNNIKAIFEGSVYSAISIELLRSLLDECVYVLQEANNNPHRFKSFERSFPIYIMLRKVVEDEKNGTIEKLFTECREINESESESESECGQRRVWFS